MKKERKEKIKNKLSKLKKPLIILSILFNILFGFSLIIGLSSNNKKTQVVKAEEPHYEIYRIKDNWKYDGNSSDWDFSSVSFNYYIDDETNGQINCVQIRKSGAGLYFKRQNESSYTMWTSYATPSGQPGYYVYNYSLTFVVTGVLPTSNNNFNRWWISSVDFVGYTDDVIPEEPTEEEDYSQNLISFGDNFNPITYITQNGDYIYNGFGGKATNQNGYFVLNLTGLTFISNGETYNTIKFYYFNLAPIVTEDGTTYIDNSGSLATQYMYCHYMEYLNIENGTTLSSVIVCSPRQTIVNDNGIPIKAYDVRPPFYVWINDEYRTIQIIDNDNSIISDEMLTIKNKTAYELLKVRNTSTQSVMGLTNVFGLLKGAFSGITGILAISILPGITLGLLLFIPLIVTIIIAVVRLIKK